MEQKGKLRFEHDAYWLQNDDGSMDGPYSVPAWDQDRTLVRKLEFSRGSFEPYGNSVLYTCLEAKSRVHVPVRFLQKNRVPHFLPALARAPSSEALDDRDWGP